MAPHALLAASIALGLAGGPTDAPRLQVSKRVHHLGEMAPGPQVKILFPIRNTGRTPLEITRVRLSCGCLAADYERCLQPGTQGTLRLLFDTVGRHGKVEKHVDIESNDPAAPRVTLTVTGTFRHDVEVAPGEDLILPLVSGTPARQDLILRASGQKAFQVKRILCASPTTHARLLSREEVADRLPGEPGAAQIVQVLFPAERTTSAFEEVVTIETGVPRRPRIAVRLTGVPREAVVANPPRLYFGSVASRNGEPLERVISLCRRTGRFRVLGVETGPGLQARVESDPSGRLCDIHVTYRGGWKPGIVEGVITIHTDDPQRPKVRVPYTADVMAALEAPSGKTVVRKG